MVSNRHNQVASVTRLGFDDDPFAAGEIVGSGRVFCAHRVSMKVLILFAPEVVFVNNGKYSIHIWKAGSLSNWWFGRTNYPGTFHHLVLLRDSKIHTEVNR